MRHASTEPNRWTRVSRCLVATLATAAMLNPVGGCGGSQKNQHSGANRRPAGVEPLARTPVNLTVTAPTDGSTGVSTATEITYTTDAPTTTVDLSDAAGTRVDGAIRPDHSAWVPVRQLDWSTRYTATITATGATGRTESRSLAFTTMAKPAGTAKATSVTGDGQVVGVGMPLIVSFSNDIPKDQRANVQRRMFVTSDPPQEGIWYWWSGKEVHYRPKEYWQSGTTISARIAIGGLPLGGNRYGAADLTIAMRVGAQIIMAADNATKQLTVTKDGQLLRTIPVSFGKHSTPSDSGNFIVMVKNQSEWFDSASFGVPTDSAHGYRIKVRWTQRITWDGKYLHSAPWSEHDQGKRNVSHGCTNLSAANAEWLYHLTQIGDPVIITGTEEHVTWQNGWTDWDRPWSEYVLGSAIAYIPPPAAALPSPSASAPAASPGRGS